MKRLQFRRLTLIAAASLPLLLSGCSHNLVDHVSGSSIAVPTLTGATDKDRARELTAAEFQAQEAALKSTPSSGRDYAELSLAHAAVETGGRWLDRKQNATAVGWYVAGIQHASNVIGRTAGARKSTNYEEAVGLYNYAIARIVTPVQELGVPSKGDDVTVAGPSREYTLKLTDSDKWIGDRRQTIAVPADVLLTPTLDRATRPGVGAPVLLKSPPLTAEQAKANFMTRKGLWYGRTVIAEFAGSSKGATMVDLRLLSGFKRATVVVAGRQVPLAADFTVALAAAVQDSKVEAMATAGVFHAGRFADRTGLYLMQPFDPSKIPVVMVHGLDSTPATWLPMINGLYKDKTLRDRYQFWYFAYPTGMPIPYSAKVLREDLDRANAKFGLDSRFHRRVVVIGHSMGGMLTQEQVVNTGDKMELAVLRGRKVEQLGLEPHDAKLLKETLVFSERPFIGRVVYLSTPHNGATLATAWFSKLAAKLITLPIQIVKVAVVATANATTPDTEEHKGEKKGRAVAGSYLPNGISGLVPNLPYLNAINSMKEGVPYHSIIGYLGDKGGPGSSDGVVPYWSSHIEGAQSEFWLKSGHSSLDMPLAIEEVKRILRLHLAKN